MDGRIWSLASAGFEAARSLPAVGAHGHGFRVRAAGADTPPDELAGFLREAVAVLDYRNLNELIDAPTDEAIARWIAATVAVPLHGLCLAGAPERGVILDASGAAQRWSGFRFEAAHRLPFVAPGHKCGRMHGHGFRVRLVQRAGEAAAGGPDLAAAWAPLAARLDGVCLNDVPGLDNPTSELIALWLWRQLDGALPGLDRVGVFETRTSGCVYDGRRFRIWKSKDFESAVPAGHGRGLAGHSYRLRLHLAGDLDAVLGWVRDFGDVKQRLEPVYRQLDHHRLDRLEDRPATDLAGLLRWLGPRLSPALPELCRIDLFEIPEVGAALCRPDAEEALPA